MYRCYGALSTSRAPSTSTGRFPPFQPPTRPPSFKPNGFAKHTKSTVDVPEQKLRKKLGSTDWSAVYTHDLQNGLYKDQTGAGKRTVGKGAPWPYHDHQNADLRDNVDEKVKQEAEHLARRSEERSARSSDADQSTTSKAADTVSGKYEEYKDKASDVLKDARDEVREVASKVSAEEKDLTGTVVETAKQWGSKAADTVKSAASTVKQTIQETTEQAKKEGKPFTTVAAEQAREKVHEISHAAAEKVDQTFGRGTAEKLQSAAGTAAESAKSAASYTAAKVADVAGSAWHKMTDKSASEVTEEMKDKAKDMAAAAKDKAADAASYASEKAYEMKDKAAEKVSEMKDSTPSTAEGIASSIKRTASGIKGKLEQFETVRRVEEKVSEMSLDPLEKQLKHTLERTHPDATSPVLHEGYFSNLSSGDKPVGDAKSFKKDKSTMDRVVERAESAAEAARDSAGRVTDAAADQISKASEAVKAKGQEFKGKVEKSWDEMQATLPKDEFARDRKKAFDMEKELKDVTREDLQKAQEAVGVIIPQNEASTADVIKTTAQEVRDDTAYGLKSATQIVKERVMQGVDKLKDAATHPPEGVKKVADSVLHTAQDTAAKVEEGISRNVGEENWREFRQVFHSLSENVKANLRARWSKNAEDTKNAPSLLTSSEISSLRKLAGAATSGIASKGAEAWSALKGAALRPKVELDGPPVGFSMALKDQDDLMEKLAQLRFSESNLRDLSATEGIFAEPRRSDTEAAAAPPTAIPADAATATPKSPDQTLSPAQKQSKL